MTQQQWDGQTSGQIWESITKIEPRLLELYEEAKSLKDPNDGRGFCANAFWYGADGLRRRMIGLVGHQAENVALHDSRPYDVAYEDVPMRSIIEDYAAIKRRMDELGRPAASGGLVRSQEQPLVGEWTIIWPEQIHPHPRRP